MKKELLRIPPYWAGMFGSIVCFIIGLVLLICGDESSSPGLSCKELIVLGVLAFLYSSINYVFYEDLFVVRLFSIPLRKIYYFNISSAVLIPRYNKYTGKQNESTILLATVPYQVDDTRVRRLLRFGYRNPIKTIYIHILLGQEETCAAVLKRCLGDRFTHQAGRDN